MRTCLITLVLIVCAPFIVVADTTNTITQFGVTFTFADQEEYGQFVNGDYWVVGPVTITSMTPDWGLADDGTTYDNGWELNPIWSATQGFLSVSYGYDASLRPTLPWTVASGSVVKTIGEDVIDSYSMIKTAVVLTVLTSIPTDNGVNMFRPPYSGTEKPQYFVSDLQTQLLPTFRSVGTPPSLAAVEANFSKCLRMDHHSTNSRQQRPAEAMADYQPENTAQLNEAMLRLMLDDSNAAKEDALVQFTQHALDRAYIIKQGYRQSGTGHNPNHRVVAAWAAVMLDITAVKTYLATATNFHEDTFLYDGINGALWGTADYATELKYWDYIAGLGGSRSYKDPYNLIDGGSLATGVASYQYITSQSLKGSALIFRLFPKMAALVPSGKLATLDEYAERWVEHGSWALPDDAAPYDGVVTNYGVTFGPDGSGSYIKGDGRWPDKDGSYPDGGQYKSAFVAAMWDAYAHRRTGHKSIFSLIHP